MVFSQSERHNQPLWGGRQGLTKAWVKTVNPKFMNPNVFHIEHFHHSFCVLSADMVFTNFKCL